jgi:hypothetical protein
VAIEAPVKEKIPTAPPNNLDEIFELANRAANSESMPHEIKAYLCKMHIGQGINPSLC